MNGSPASPHSADSNSNIPSSSQSLLGNSRHLLVDGQITPSISLIPIKQEPSNDDYNDSSHRKSEGTKDEASAPPNNSHTSNNSMDTNNSTPSSSLTSLIKVCKLILALKTVQLKPIQIF